MRIKLVSCDYDSTLIDRKSIISKKNIANIRLFIEKGGVFCVNTGRPISSIRTELIKYKLDDLNIPIIANIGSQIFYPNFENTIKDYPILNEDVVKVINQTTKHNVIVSITSSAYTYINKYNFISKILIKSLSLESTFKIVPNLSDIVPSIKEPIYKINVIRNGILSSLINVEKDLSFPSLNIHTVPDSDFSFQVVSALADKGKGLATLTSSLNIDLKDCLAIGDSLNDIEMYDVAGSSVCVKNGSAISKLHAQYISKFKNSESAVGVLLEDLINDNFPSSNLKKNKHYSVNKK
jgi:Cof subfamily protein (haloacid dehalogenase superfamily)